MTQLMKVYPQYLGIGLDEATAIVGDCLAA